MQGLHTHTQGLATVNSLRIPIISIDADGLWIETVVDTASFHPAEGRTLPLTRLQLSGDLTPLDEGELLFRGTVEGAFGHACDRCLAEAEFPFSVEVLWQFVAKDTVPGGVKGDEGEIVFDAEELDDPAMDYSYDGNEVDLSLALWEEAEMALPLKYICREDCRGLCPVCGGDRNEKPCACDTASEAEINPGLAGLKDMFPELPEQHAEE